MTNQHIIGISKLRPLNVSKKAKSSRRTPRLKIGKKVRKFFEEAKIKAPLNHLVRINDTFVTVDDKTRLIRDTNVLKSLERFQFNSRQKYRGSSSQRDNTGSVNPATSYTTFERATGAQT